MSDQTNKGEVHSGQCMCGAVQIEVTGEPLWTASCHCSDCRAVTGADRSAFAGYAADKVIITGNTYIEYPGAKGTRRGFCSTCGSRITCQGDSWANETHLHTGVMENAGELAPAVNVYVKDKLPWVELEAGLPAFQTTPRQEME